MPFVFIHNNAAIDRTARRRIRSHVAMGRNAGRKLVRPSRKETFALGVKTTTAHNLAQDSAEQAHDLEGSEATAPVLERQIGDGLSVSSFPEQTPRSRGLVQRAFSFISGPRHAPELHNALDASGTSTSMWVQFMFLDEAYFHCAVALSVIALNGRVIQQEGHVEAMRHLSHAFRLVNEKLCGSDAISDETMAVVILMSKYASLQRQDRQVIVHLEGLQRMVELRGGISQVTKDKPGLAQKIFRGDLENSLHLGSATRFSIEDIVAGSTAVVGLPNSLERQNDRTLPKPLAEPLDSWVFRRLDTDLRNLLIDVTCFARLLNDADAGLRPKVHGYTYHDALLLLGYRVVCISPLSGPRPTSRLENALHLGLTAFIITFMRGFDGLIMDIPRLSELARSAAQEHFDTGREDQEVLLWLLFIGGASVFRQPEDAWLLPKTAQTMDILGLQTWEDVRRTLTKFPWVSAAHDKAGQWLSSTSRSRPPGESTSE